MIIGFVNKHGNTFLKRSALFVKPADSLLCKLPEYTWLLPPTKRIFAANEAHFCESCCNMGHSL